MSVPDDNNGLVHYQEQVTAIEQHGITEYTPAENSTNQDSRIENEDEDEEDDETISVSINVDESTKPEIGSEVWLSNDRRDPEGSIRNHPLATLTTKDGLVPVDSEQQDLDYNDQASTDELEDIFDGAEYQDEAINEHDDNKEQKTNPPQQELDYNTADLGVGANEYQGSDAPNLTPSKTAVMGNGAQKQTPDPTQSLERGSFKRGHEGELPERDDEKQGIFLSFPNTSFLLLSRFVSDISQELKRLRSS